MSPAVTGSAFTLLDNFDGYDNSGDTNVSAGITNGVWNAEHDQTDFADIVDSASAPGNQVLTIHGGGNGGGGNWRGVDTDLSANWNAGVAHGNSATYFFQFQARSGGPSDFDVMMGLTDDVTNIDSNESWQDFAVMPFLVGPGSGGGGLTFRASKDGQPDEVILDGVALDQWYNVWLVVDNAAKTYDVYTSTDNAVPTLGANDATYRNGLGGGDLDAFGWMSGKDASVAFDNLYHAAGVDLSNPLALEPTFTAHVALNTGRVYLVNHDDEAVELDYYLLESEAGALSPSTWQSMADGDGSPTGWTQAGGATETQLAELNLTGSTVLEEDASMDLGSAYDPAVFGQLQEADLELKYGVAGQDALRIGGVAYFLDGDYNDSGLVEQGDLDLVLQNWGESVRPAAWSSSFQFDGFVDQGELDRVLQNWGDALSPSSASTSPLPEPGSAALLMLGGLAAGRASRSRRRVSLRKNVQRSATRFAFVPALLTLTALGVFAPTGQAQDTGYVFAYFQGGWPTGGHSGVYMEYSEDGLNFAPMNNGDPVFVPPEAWGPGTDTDINDEDQARDPSVVYGPDGYFHMVWTSGINTRSIGYARSADLQTWTDEQLIDIWDTSTVVNHTWAPELFYDEVNAKYQIIFASDLDGGDHKLYSITTDDFGSFSAPDVFYYNGATVIDAMIARDNDNNQYLMAIKDEQGDQKNIRLATGPTAQGPWSTSNPIIVGPGSAIEGNVTEGPSLLKIGDTWHMYYDAYGAGYFGVAATDDPDPTDASEWVNLTSQADLPSGHHGTVFAASLDTIAFDFLPYARSDLTGDETIDVADWTLFAAYHLVDLSQLGDPADYGDLDGDGDNDFTDFRLFQADYDRLNGDGSFAVMLDAVPEPAALALIAPVALACRTRRRYGAIR